MIAERLKRIKPSGVRRIFDMASRMNDPIDLNRGEPDFDIPEVIKQEGIRWIEGGFNKYTLVVAFNCHMGKYIDHYREKRNFIYEALRKRYREGTPLGSFFYISRGR